MVRSSEPLLLHAMLALRLLLLCLHPHTAALWAMRYHIDKAEADPFVRIKSILEVIAYLSPRAAAKFLLCGMHKPWTSTTVFQPPPPSLHAGSARTQLSGVQEVPSNSENAADTPGCRRPVCHASSHSPVTVPPKMNRIKVPCM